MNLAMIILGLICIGASWVLLHRRPGFLADYLGGLGGGLLVIGILRMTHP